MQIRETLTPLIRSFSMSNSNSDDEDAVNVLTINPSISMFGTVRSPEDIVYQGYLLKRGEFLQNWRQRFFILFRDGAFFGFKYAPPNFTNPLNVFTVKDIQMMKTDRPRENAFLIRGLQVDQKIERTFCAPTADERRAWMHYMQLVSDCVETGNFFDLRLTADFEEEQMDVTPPNEVDETVAVAGLHQEEQFAQFDTRTDSSVCSSSALTFPSEPQSSSNNVAMNTILQIPLDNVPYLFDSNRQMQIEPPRPKVEPQVHAPIYVPPQSPITQYTSPFADPNVPFTGQVRTAPTCLSATSNMAQLMNVEQYKYYCLLVATLQNQMAEIQQRELQQVYQQQQLMYEHHLQQADDQLKQQDFHIPQQESANDRKPSDEKKRKKFKLNSNQIKKCQHALQKLQKDGRGFVLPLKQSNQFVSLNPNNLPDEITSQLPKPLVKPKPKAARSVITLDHFQFLSVLGKGTFGKVLLGKEKRTNRLYALKFLNKEVLINKDEVQHTYTENRVLQRCKHPFLTQMIYTFQTTHYLCFVMEFVGAGDLYTQLNNHIQKNKRGFPEPRVQFYAAEILLAIGFLHDNKIVYRDLKLENLLLDRFGHIKIADFGLCKEDMSINDRTSTVCGTPEYLAPEVIENLNYGRSVDFWSLGVVIYEMLVGRLPFYTQNHGKLFELILNAPVRFPSSLSANARLLLSGLLMKDPSKRLGSGQNDWRELLPYGFFEGIDWNLLYQKQIEPPFVPELDSEYDTRYFDSDFTKAAVQLTPPTHRKGALETLDEEELQQKFVHFSFRDTISLRDNEEQ
ncbi:RAC serine/threonine-protein kinase [Aphelenchoides besseyi]|nr:RAC serine/threonine-protein kinase [Aphelenchoides besseyi]KAI6211126.1 RAC serine/threonine-protein kinase [Aphelenchoides besseyi]